MSKCGGAALRTRRDQQLCRRRPTVDNFAARNESVLASSQELGRAGARQAILDQAERAHVIGHVEVGLGIAERERLLALDPRCSQKRAMATPLLRPRVDVKCATVLDAIELERRRLGQVSQMAVASQIRPQPASSRMA